MEWRANLASGDGLHTVIQVQSHLGGKKSLECAGVRGPRGKECKGLATLQITMAGNSPDLSDAEQRYRHGFETCCSQLSLWGLELKLMRSPEHSTDGPDSSFSSGICQLEAVENNLLKPHFLHL